MAFRQWYNAVILFLLLLQRNVRTSGHSLGEHSLTGEEPTGDPTLPEITGAFELEFKVRYIGLSSKYQALLEYTDSNNGQETLFFAHKPSTGDLLMDIKVGGVYSECYGPNVNAIPTVGELHTIKMRLDSNGKVELFMDGTLTKECTGLPLPSNTARIHTVGTGAYATLWNTVEVLQGAIVGLRVTNLSAPSTSALDRFKFLSLPGQPRRHAFVASFYTRFDDLSRSSQHVFDFCDDAGNNRIACSQRSTSNDMECWIKNDAVDPVYKVTAANSIVAGDFAFWHFGINSDGTMWISKDGAVLANQPEPTLVLPDIFRKMLLFGNSYASNVLDGVVLGFRLDRGEPLTTSR